VDVEAAFADENPTTPKQDEAEALSQHPEALGYEEVDVSFVQEDGPPVRMHVPLDVVPMLAVPRTDLPWTELGELATQLLLRVDGSTCTMEIVTGVAAAPNESARELADLVGRGLVRLAIPDEVSPPELDLDLSIV